MPKAPSKKGKGKGPKPETDERGSNGAPNGASESATAVATAVEEAPSDELRPPTTPVETREEEKPAPAPRSVASGDKDHIAASLNIAKLQAMSMTELNQMARDLGVENFGTMRKHEVIFHILQKNAERAGLLFSEGVLEVLPEGFGFLR